MPEKPWIILTLRRTGGTQLASALSALSAFPTIQHEPLNGERKLGALTRGYRATGDAAALARELHDALSARPNIKHCIENVPIPVTRALVDAADALGYYMMILTRRDEVRRIGSLLLAQATGAWGNRKAETIYPEIISGTRTPDPVDLDKLASRVQTDCAALGHTLRLLRNRGALPDWHVFEEIYHDADLSAARVADIARRSGIAVTDDDIRLAALRNGDGNQHSDRIAPYVPHYAEALARLEALCPS